MNILYVSPVSWRWLKQRPHFLAEEFAGHGHGVDFLFWANPLSFKKHAQPVKQNLTLIEKYVFPFSAKSGLVEKINIACIQKILAHKQYTCIVLTHPRQLPYIPERLLDGARLYYDCMDNLPFFYSDAARTKLIALEAVLCGKTTMNIVSSGYLKNALRTRHALPREKIAVIRNAVPASITQYAVKDVHFTTPSALYLGTIGSWIDWPLLDSFARKHPEFSIYMLGSANCAIPLALPDNVIFLSPRPHEDMVSYIYAADVLLIPFTPSELTRGVDPVKMYEYLACNKPVVSAFWDELEPFGRQKNVFFYQSGDDFERCMLAAVECEKSPERYDYSFIARNNWGKRAEMFINLMES
jgi:glycosyltransferase involved in cell wall biosynthesis